MKTPEELAEEIIIKIKNKHMKGKLWVDLNTFDIDKMFEDAVVSSIRQRDAEWVTSDKVFHDHIMCFRSGIGNVMENERKR